MSSPPRAPSMTDVAQLAGVSHQTVSRVLNDHPSVRPETRERVRAAIADLGYRRNLAARALVTRQTRTIGIVTSGSALFGPTSTLVALETAAREAGYFVGVATVARWEAEPLRLALEHFLAQGVDGLVVVATHDEAVAVVRQHPLPVPVVMVGPTELGGTGLHSVAVDQYAGARLAVRHLLDLGHSHVLHVAGPSDWRDARHRVAGWADELMAAGVDPGEPVEADWTADRGYEVGRELAGGTRPLPTAVFAANDQLALGLLRALAEAGLRVPDDVSVVGFDDVDGSAHFHPPLTTVRQEFGALGRRCMAVLLDALAGRSHEDDPVRPRLVVRASSGPPRGSGPGRP